MKNKELPVHNREMSWLAFNGRVLQEAADPAVPLLERLKFLGIFSNNLDEFYRVRVATVRRLTKLHKKERAHLNYQPAKLLLQIQEKVLEQTHAFEVIYEQIKKDLKRHHLHILNEQEALPAQVQWLHSFFHDHIRSHLFPFMVTKMNQLPALKDKSIYLAVRGYGPNSRKEKKKKKQKTEHYSIIEIPVSVTGRFVVLPNRAGRHYVMLVDDVIRMHLNEVYAQFGFEHIEAYTFKITRDAELDLESDLSKSWLEKISKGVKQRKAGDPVRFVYDAQMPGSLLKLFTRSLQLTAENVIPGGRYHNFRDFMQFPSFGNSKLVAPAFKPITPPELRGYSLFAAMEKKDVLLHYPYHSFSHMTDWLREAAIDPQVSSIHITLYRLAQQSQIINALINASQNGKQVTAVLEIQARFDEEANIRWARKLQEEGIKVIYGVPGLKVHAKLCLIRKSGKGYVNFSTGNYNEQTAKIYSDEALFTTHAGLVREVEAIFDFFDKNYKSYPFKHLVLSPYRTRKKLLSWIDQEIQQAKAGQKAGMMLKMNSLVDRELIEKLYEASAAGVPVQLIIRGICCLKAGVPGLSEHIRCVSIVDQFLEHSRIFYFEHGGDPQVYISSSDWMGRNLDFRIEVTVPIYDSQLKAELQEMLQIQLRGVEKTRVLDSSLDNRMQTGKSGNRPQERFARRLGRKLG
jgi:polyphosphate kinase